MGQFIDMIAIYRAEDQDNGWCADILSENREYHILVLLWPLLNRFSSSVCTWMQENNISLFRARDLRIFILNLAKKKLFGMVIKSCIVELNDGRTHGLLSGDSAESRYDHFIQILATKKNQIKFFEKYPVLAEKALQLIELKEEFLTELLSRVHHDRELIRSSFFSSAHEFQLTTITPLGDSHGKARNVCKLGFAGGATVIYKPRNIQIDVVYYDFISWFNTISPIKMQAAKSVASSGYGWCEYIDHKTCESKDEVTLYYHRFGILIALVHILVGGDMHNENIIAHRGFPIVIDHECLLFPEVDYNYDSSGNFSLADTPPQKRFVTFSYLLPVAITDGRSSLDISAFAGPDNKEKIEQKILGICNAGTDEMCLKEQNLYVRQENNRPTLNNKQVNPMDYAEIVESGFEMGYGAFLDHKTEFLNNKKLLAQFKAAVTRVVFRPTTAYTHLLRESFHPRLLVDESKYKKHFDVLAESALHMMPPSEYKQLMAGDIPSFYTRCDSNKIYDSHGEELPLQAITSGFDKFVYNIKHYINRNDLQTQSFLISLSLTTYCLNKKLDCNYKLIDSLPITMKAGASIADRAALAAKEVLTRLMNKRIYNGDIIAWPQMTYSDPYWRVTLTKVALYEGLSGILLPFAFAGEIFNDSAYIGIAEESINKINLYLGSIKSISKADLGLFSGISGILYSVCALAKLSHHYRLDLIISKLETILNENEQNILKLEVYDIISGSAGIMIALLGASNLLSEGLLKQLIATCLKSVKKGFYELLDKYQSETVVTEKTKLLGFAHGLFGIIYALEQYLKKYHDASVKKIIKDFYVSLENEGFLQSLYEEGALNHDVPINMNWCNGIAGMAFTRLQALKNPYLKDCVMPESLKKDVDIVCKFEKFNNLNLCHGGLGSLDLLLESANDGFIEFEKYERAAASVIDVISAGHYCTNRDSKAYIASLLLGHAGVAYQLLRIMKPNLVPSILI